ncbi:MAG: T9SS type A sorting domain-containing protein, partial [Sphingomonadales bacterium]|nr:T9SS type A sorting domain-containing protein [Sphingomonadales bacterium]
GNWNHWAFTKNSTTGVMSIYLNGTLWLSGSSKTKAITIKNLLLGSDQNGGNNYKGKINQLSIWNKVLTAAEIKDWMYKKIDGSHPKYAHLVGDYSFREGAGLNIENRVSDQVSTGKNLVWTFDRGDDLNRNFSASSEKPQITLLTGNYNRTVTNIEQRDSVKRSPNVINRYRIEDKSAAGIVTHDLLKIDSTFALYEARKSMVYKGETGVLLDSIAVKSAGVINLVKLNYSLRFPWYNELVSFVTPYGINLDLGMAGKSWYFDMTDFAPLLKGKKRLVVAMGGQNQEQMEMEFLFIVGKPVRSVLSMNQLWQGGARLGGPGIGSILNNSVFAPVDVPLLSSAKSFKLRSTITGHGSDGEFEQNGGPITHTLNVAGNAMSWSLVMDCSVNPMIAQGGTWLIPRQGWCPGWRSKLMEHEITKFVTPGKTETIDYEISQPTKSGDYRYIVAHQLVEYGDMNFDADARIVEVLRPTGDYEFAKANPMCSQPAVLVQNTGKSTIKTIKFTYWMNDASVKQSWHWAGNLASLDTATIVLPTWDLWGYGMKNSGNIFHCEVAEVNGVADEYPLNSRVQSKVTIPDVLPGNFKIEFRTNNFPTENAFKLLDADGKVVVKDSFTVANKTSTYTLNLNGCYKLLVYDYGLDGLNWWANTAQGTGAVRLRNAATNAILKTFIADFGSYFEYSFTTNYALRTSEQSLEQAVNVYPNPASGQFSLEGERLDGASVVITDLLGKRVAVMQEIHGSRVNFETAGWAKGVYTVVITKGGVTATKKVVVY